VGRCEWNRIILVQKWQAIDGVVVQERAGWTHVLAVAFDLRTTTERERTELSTVVRPVGDREP